MYAYVMQIMQVHIMKIYMYYANLSSTYIWVLKSPLASEGAWENIVAAWSLYLVQEEIELIVENEIMHQSCKYRDHQ